MIAPVLLPNIIAMILLLVLLLSASRVSRHTIMLDSRIFSLMAACNFFQCAGEIFSYAIDGVVLPGFHELGLLINTCLFIVNISFAYLWVIYADYKIFESLKRIKKRAKILAIPAAVIILGSLINLFTPVFFQITADNFYQRSNLYPIPFAVTYFYLIYGMVFIYRHKSQARRYVFLPAALFLLPIFLGSIIQFAFYGISTVWVGAAIGLMAVYVNMQNETSYIDSLSGVYTRVYMHQYLQNALRRGGEKKIAGIMMDIDRFKSINDEFGHLVGDDAIRSTGKLFHSTLHGHGFAARYGGDEFIVLEEVESEQDVANTLALIHQAEEEFNRTKGKPYKLHFSLGWSILDTQTDTIDSFLGRMDNAMYESKRLLKERQAAEQDAGQAATES